jgi:oxalate decarboxylase
MPDTNRRFFLGALALGAGGLASAKSFADGNDGHAAGYDVAPASSYLPVIPRRSGEPVTFTTSLDKGPIKATSGGWARDITARHLPIATDIAGAHLFINAGGAREMHWHNSAEWAYILGGHCQVTVVDPEGELEVANYDPGDLWYFPKGHGHAIQTLGTEPCHAILAFDDGLYGEHGTFGISDWMSRFDADTLAHAFGVRKEWLANIPPGETYIKQGEIIARDGPQARTAAQLKRARSHRYRLMEQKPWASTPGGTIHVASAREFPLQTSVTGMVVKLKPGAMHEPHWHPTANEWHYVVKGRTKVTLFAPDKRLAVAELSAGDCAYLPRGCGHSVKNIGTEDCEIVGVLDSHAYVESSLSDWLAKAPRHLLANNFGMPEGELAKFGGKRPVIVAAV